MAKIRWHVSRKSETPVDEQEMGEARVAPSSPVLMVAPRLQPCFTASSDGFGQCGDASADIPFFLGSFAARLETRTEESAARASPRTEVEGFCGSSGEKKGITESWWERWRDPQPAKRRNPDWWFEERAPPSRVPGVVKAREFGQKEEGKYRPQSRKRLRPPLGPAAVTPVMMTSPGICALLRGK